MHGETSKGPRGQGSLKRMFCVLGFTLRIFKVLSLSSCTWVRVQEDSHPWIYWCVQRIGTSVGTSFRDLLRILEYGLIFSSEVLTTMSV